MAEDYYGRESIVAEGKGLYTRLELRHKVSGEIEPVSSKPAPLKRIWPGEPNVGWVEQQMAFKVDGAVRIGGPTLKTYDLNNDRQTSAVREVRMVMDDIYRKLRASEDQEALADVLNAHGCWESSATIAAGAFIEFDTEAKGDVRTFDWNGTDTVNLLRRGTYLISYRGYAIPNAGALRVSLGIGSDTVQWRCVGGPTAITVSDTMTYEMADDTAVPVSLELSAGTSFGSSTLLRTILSITKVR